MHQQAGKLCLCLSKHFMLLCAYSTHLSLRVKVKDQGHGQGHNQGRIQIQHISTPLHWFQPSTVEYNLKSYNLDLLVLPLYIH